MSRTSKEEIRHAIFTEVQSREFNQPFQEMQEASRALALFTDAGELVHCMHQRDNGKDEEQDIKNRVLRDLIIAAKYSRKYSSAAQSLCIAALWPGLDRVSKQVESSPEPIQDSFAEVYNATLQEIQSWDMDKQDKIAANILLNVKKRVLMLYDAVRETETTPFKSPDNTDDDVDAGAFEGGADEVVDEKTVESQVEEELCSSALDRLVAANVISPQESLLIVLRVFQGHELDAIAESLGISYKTLCRRYERAIERLEKFFKDEKGYWAFLNS
ncbi:MAG TPA: sigma factor-like helix-turn-helix DNA-binding protein [bacterium]|nr:sigma factor-like helix-turn-helix DNA-binding protein [bacterium]